MIPAPPPSQSARTARLAAAALLGLFVVAVQVGEAAAAPDPTQTGPHTASLQGDQAAWIKDPHTRAFWRLTVRAFAGGKDHLDREAYDRDARAIFRDFGPSMGLSPDAMEAHLALLPAQVIKIASEDPRVLDSFDAFVAAIFGPP